jgi:exonuclease III
MKIFPLFSLFSLLSFTRSDTECPLILVPGQDRRPNKSTLRLVQYNVEWLFIDEYSAAKCPGTGCAWTNVSEAETHLSYVAKVVQDLNPDILNLCEVEGCDELNQLADQLSNADEYNVYLKKGTDTGTGQNVGMLTKIDPLVSLYRTENRFSYPIEGSKCGSTYTSGSQDTGVSKHYITEFTFTELQIAFISAHLIAIPTDPERCAQREAQAMVLQEMIYNYLLKDYEIIFIGDLNDYDAEVLDLNGNQPLSQVLDILKGYSGVYAGQYELFSVAENIVKTERFSDWWDSDNNCNTSSQKDYSMIDHILVTEPIKKYIKNVFLYHGYDEYCGTYNSDHYPLIIDLFF